MASWSQSLAHVQMWSSAELLLDEPPAKNSPNEQTKTCWAAIALRGTQCRCGTERKSHLNADRLCHTYDNEKQLKLTSDRGTTLSHSPVICIAGLIIDVYRTCRQKNCWRWQHSSQHLVTFLISSPTMPFQPEGAFLSWPPYLLSLTSLRI